jgi:putative transposase
MSRGRYKIWESAQPHFLTCSVVDWLPVFTRPEAAEVVLESWRFLQANDRLALFGYVVMENHLHFIASAPDLAAEVKNFKSFTARRVIDCLEQRADAHTLDRLGWSKLRHKTESRYQFWQEGSHPKQITSDEMMVQKLEYVHNNPVRRGYVDLPEHWRYSSARNYLGLPGLISVTTGWR